MLFCHYDILRVVFSQNAHIHQRCVHCLWNFWITFGICLDSLALYDTPLQDLLVQASGHRTQGGQGCTSCAEEHFHQQLSHDANMCTVFQQACKEADGVLFAKAHDDWDEPDIAVRSSSVSKNIESNLVGASSSRTVHSLDTLDQRDSKDLMRPTGELCRCGTFVQNLKWTVHLCILPYCNPRTVQSLNFCQRFLSNESVGSRHVVSMLEMTDELSQQFAGFLFQNTTGLTLSTE